MASPSSSSRTVWPRSWGLGRAARGAARVAIDPTGARAVVSDYWLGGLGAPSDIAVIGLETLEVDTVREVCPAPHHAAWDPAGARIAVTCSLSDEIVILDGDASVELARGSSIPMVSPSPTMGPWPT